MTGLASHKPSRIAQENIADKLSRALRRRRSAMRLDQFLQPCGHVGALDGVERAIVQRLPVHGEIPRRGLVGVRPHRCRAWRRDSARPLRRGSTPGAAAAALRSRVSAQLDLGKALARDLAGIFEPDLAHVAQAFAPLLASRPGTARPSACCGHAAERRSRAARRPIRCGRSCQAAGRARQGPLL